MPPTKGWSVSAAPKYDWPPDDELVTKVAAYNTNDLAAEALGIPSRTLASRLGHRGMRGRVQDIRRRKVVETEPEPVDEVSELELVRQERDELRKRLATDRKEEIADERVVRRLEEALKYARPHKFQPRPRRRVKAAPHEMVLLFSDTHAYEQVSATETLGMNEYNRDVLLQRMTRLRDGVLSYVEHRPYPVTKLHVWMLGDMLSGDIHPELAETNELCHEEATVQFALDASSWLEGFTGHFDHIRVSGVPGNHPRRSAKPQAKRAHNNSDWVCYQMIQLYHRGRPEFSFHFPKAAYAVETVAERWRCLLMHGDGIRSTMPGVPWGGVVRRITTLEQQFSKAKQPLDFVALGHFHTANALDGVGVKTFLNGSVKGIDEYSLRQFGSGRAPSQVLLTFHKDHGVSDVSYIDLVDVQPAASPLALAA